MRDIILLLLGYAAIAALGFRTGRDMQSRRWLLASIDVALAAILIWAMGG